MSPERSGSNSVRIHDVASAARALTRLPSTCAGPGALWTVGFSAALAQLIPELRITAETFEFSAAGTLHPLGVHRNTLTRYPESG